MSEKAHRPRRLQTSGLTYHEVMKAGRAAWRRSEKDEFVYLPQGIVYYRSLRPGGPTTYGCSMRVQDRTTPDEGWAHQQPCDCEFCRAAT
jgi:hypothetical protein